MESLIISDHEIINGKLAYIVFSNEGDKRNEHPVFSEEFPSAKRVRDYWINECTKKLGKEQVSANIEEVLPKSTMHPIHQDDSIIDILGITQFRDRLLVVLKYEADDRVRQLDMKTAKERYPAQLASFLEKRIEFSKDIN